MSQKTIIFIIIAVLFVGGIAYLTIGTPSIPKPTPVVQDETKDWKILFAQIAQAKIELKTFSAEAGYEEFIKENRGFGIEGFVLKHPKDWQAEERSSGVANIIDFKDIAKGYPGNNYIVLSISVAPNQGGLTLEDWSGEVIKQSGYQKTGTISISGLKTFKLEKAESEAGPRYVFFTAERTGGWIFDIQSVGLDEITINQILSTFEFIKS